jgi:hypothetical protein
MLVMFSCTTFLINSGYIEYPYENKITLSIKFQTYVDKRVSLMATTGAFGQSVSQLTQTENDTIMNVIILE